MKKIVFIVLIFITNICYSQTILDSLIISKINDYRRSNYLNNLIWDQRMYKVGDNQTEYMSITNLVTHDQTDLKIDFNIEPDFNKRFIKNLNISTDDTLNYLFGENLISLNLIENESDDDLSCRIVNAWIESVSHHELLLNNIMNYAAINHKIKKNVNEYDINYGMFFINNKIYISFECINN